MNKTSRFILSKNVIKLFYFFITFFIFYFLFFKVFNLSRIISCEFSYILVFISYYHIYKNDFKSLTSKFKKNMIYYGFILGSMVAIITMYFSTRLISSDSYIAITITISIVLIFLYYFFYKNHLFIKNESKIFNIILLIFIFIKIFLCSAQYPAIGPFLWAGHDDALLLSHAESITQGAWLGEYNHLTLAKGMIYPLWLAFVNWLSVPIIPANQLLYSFACLYTILVIKKIIKNKFLLFFIFSLLLFNPASYDVMSLRYYRDSIYPAICIIFFMSLIGLFLNQDKIKPMIIHASISGISLGAAWNTREDSFWLLPFLFAVLMITFLFITFTKRNKTKFYICILTPVVIFFILNAIVSFLNLHYYGRFVVNDYMSSEFQGAYGALTRVENERWIPDVPVPEDVRLKIYKVSPAFNELKEHLENNDLKLPTIDGRKDFNGGYFFWALRAAAEAAGHYENPMEAKRFFETLEKEVNDACDLGLLKAQAKKRATLAPVFKNQYIKPTINATVQAFNFINEFYNISSIPIIADDYENEDKLRHIAAYLHSSLTPKEFLKVDTQKYIILEDIKLIYQKLNPILTIIGAIFYLLILLGIVLKLIKKKDVKHELSKLLILSGIGLMLFLRLVMIAFVHVSSFLAINVQYLSSAYPLLMLFSALSIGFIYENISLIIKSKSAKNLMNKGG